MPGKYNRDPLISVIIPFYNGSRTIRVAIDSILRQTYKRYEIIVVDDGSPEKAGDILNDFLDRVKIVTQPNQGTLSARNTGMANMRGDFIAFLDQDDWWERDKLKHQIRFMQKHNNIGLVCSNLIAVNDRGEKLGFTVIPKAQRHDPTWEELICMHRLYPSSSLIRAELFSKVRYDTQFGLSGAYGDQDFHARLREITDFHYMDRCLGYYRWDVKRADTYIANFDRFAVKQWRHPKLSDKDGAQIRQHFAEVIRTEIIILFKELLAENENSVDLRLLNRLIDYQNTLCSQLGPDFVELAGIKVLDLSTFELDDLTCTMLYVFLMRLDYQQAFPEVYGGDLSRYLNWIKALYSGQLNDSDKQVLDQEVRKALLADLFRINIDAKHDESINRLIPFIEKFLIASRTHIEEKGIFEFMKAVIERIIKLDFHL